MEVIVCALPIEAKALKEHFNNDVKIFTCGPKAKNLEILKTLNEHDHVTNIGICAGKNIGKMYLCNKIVGEREDYPDILTDCNIAQLPIKTVDYIVGADEVSSTSNLLFDQEAAIVFREAMKYIAPHQISFLKIVSDCGSPNFEVIKNQISGLFNNNIDKIKEFIYENNKIFQKIPKKTELDKLDYYSELLGCNVNMRNMLKQLITYANTINKDIDCFFSNINFDKPLTKQESIKAIDNLQKFLTK